MRTTALIAAAAYAAHVEVARAARGDAVRSRPAPADGGVAGRARVERPARRFVPSWRGRRRVVARRVLGRA